MECELPADRDTWTREHVREWLLGELDLGEATAQILYEAEFRGDMLPLLDEDSLLKLGVKPGPAKLIIRRLSEFSADAVKNSEASAGVARERAERCLPYPFNCFHDSCRYVLHRRLQVPETGPLNLIEPCHEFKALQGGTHREKLTKFTEEAVRFAAACLNTRSNGTIHFGVLDNPHGKIAGVGIGREAKSDKGSATKSQEEDYVRAWEAFGKYFAAEHKETVMKCIKVPRFVEVLNPNCDEENTFVIEVDIEPRHALCREDLYYTSETLTNKKTKKHSSDRRHLYIRQGSSIFDLMAENKDKNIPKHSTYSRKTIKEISELRKKAEQEHSRGVQNSMQGSQLTEAITNGSGSLDKSNFEWYILVTNKSHPVQLESLHFLTHLDLFAVLDFDPESKSEGLYSFFREQRKARAHFPEDYTRTDLPHETVRKLELSKIISWVFCNGSVTDAVRPSFPTAWRKEKGASVRRTVSFLCRTDVMPRGRFQVLFLLLSRVDHQMDPLLEAFSSFYQELGGVESMLFICNSESTCNSWKDLVDAKFGEQITDRCIYKLNLAEVNGTVLSLTRSSERFLPCHNAATIVLWRRDEEGMHALSVLCVNQCEGQQESRDDVQRSFYRGATPTWWNFHLSEESVVKRDKHEYIKRMVRLRTSEPESGACVTFDLFHHPGCGGTTLAMHVLWSLRKELRCAILKDNAVGHHEVARQVISLLKYGIKERSTSVFLPVLLMIDGFEDKNKELLQEAIREEIKLEDLTTGDTLVVILSCAKSQTQPKGTGNSDTVFLGNKLSANEKKLFEQRLKEIEMDQKEVETFYSFMIMKNNFDPEYITRVVKSNLQHFNFVEQKEAKLFGVLVLLHVYAQCGSLSVSFCERFLGLEGQPRHGYLRVEEEFGQFSKLVTRCAVEEGEKYQAVRPIHRSVSQKCLEELTRTHSVTKRDIVLLLLQEDAFHDCTQGKKRLEEDIVGMLCTRRSGEDERDSSFSPLMQAIVNETPEAVKDVLTEACRRFENNALILHLHALFYIDRDDVTEALKWAKKAKNKDRKSFLIADTLAEVYRRELTAKVDTITAPAVAVDDFRELLKLACFSLSEFSEAQHLLTKETNSPKSNPHRSARFPASCFLGEISVYDIILKLLRKSPLFAQNNGVKTLVRYLSGDVTVDDLLANNGQHSGYITTLQEHNEHLHNLKMAMKKQIDFLECYLSNFTLPCSAKVSLMVTDLDLCFRTYSDVFCRLSPGVDAQSEHLQVEEKRKDLERMKADTCSGILRYLTDKQGYAAIEAIVQSYQFILHKPHGEMSLREELHLILASIVLRYLSPRSTRIYPVQKEDKLKSDLKKAIQKSTQTALASEEKIALHFLSSLLCWDEEDVSGERPVQSALASLTTCFSEQFRCMSPSASLVAHFFLGKQASLSGILSRAEADQLWEDRPGCTTEEDPHFFFCGVVKESGILCDTDRGTAVPPVGRVQPDVNSRVTFRFGFTLAGPRAFSVRHWKQIPELHGLYRSPPSARQNYLN
ncbi:sterile alpha motif domain-containing protein 9-like [Megalops cyprinoides]|uniref:sterile alpha motif domain-containing protein 9-like n=1 Tax=Megalops cyprinoides TaxID=118141 RepID=UPI001864BF5B|nr:sterile alpha motif domain-containing protein 9-like [Megalops cyprinoides]